MASETMFNVPRYHSLPEILPKILRSLENAPEAQVLPEQYGHGIRLHSTSHGQIYCHDEVELQCGAEGDGMVVWLQGMGMVGSFVAEVGNVLGGCVDMDVSLVLERDGGERSGGGGISIGDSIRWYVARDSNEDGAVFFSSPRMSCFGIGRRAAGMSGLLPGRREAVDTVNWSAVPAGAADL